MDRSVPVPCLPVATACPPASCISSWRTRRRGVAGAERGRLLAHPPPPHTGADRFISTLPNTYETVLSDAARGTGAQLSAGQRQLLALARAIAARPAVPLLDEATATVDGASDAAFRAALREHVLPTGTAVITIAHRLATARDADSIIVLDDGRITEKGSPEDLLAADTAFAAQAALEDAGWDCQQRSAQP
jgi:ATP-binding cassette subfamily B protein